ncbi:MAG: hypothetical protein ACKVJE_20170 [Pseudomonadales bacterium]
MYVNINSPSRDLYNRVRGGFVIKGLTLSEWCRSQEIKPQNALSCLVGTWNGPKALTLRKRLILAAGLKLESDSDSHEGAA